MKHLLVLILALSLFNCSSQNESITSNDLGWLLNADPELDAKQAIKSGDLRYFGVVGMSIQVPFFNRECISNDRVNFIQISDLVESYEQEKLQAIAPIYAFNYNLYMSKYYKKHNLKDCGS